MNDIDRIVEQATRDLAPHEHYKRLKQFRLIARLAYEDAARVVIARCEPCKGTGMCLACTPPHPCGHCVPIAAAIRAKLGN